jgi:hypothetical protein
MQSRFQKLFEIRIGIRATEKSRSSSLQRAGVPQDKIEKLLNGTVRFDD